VEPRYQKSSSVQRVAVVLDSSASMAVFKEAALQRLADELPKLQGPAAGMEFTVLEATPGKPRLFAGTSLNGLMTAIKKWQPSEGLTDPTQALRLARSLVSREGSVIYVTDTPTDSLPFESRLMAVGEPIANVGFTGITFTEEEGQLVWHALVRNYSREPQERTWSLQSNQGNSEPRPLKIEPGALVTLQAAFPIGAENVRVVLSPDPFTSDDVLPLVREVPKPLTLFSATSPAYEDLAEKLSTSLDSISPSQDAATADLTITSYDPLDPVLPTGNAILFVEDGTSAGNYLKGGILAESHPLLNGLNWQSLLVRETIQLERQPTDKIILWQESRPLIFIRELRGKRLLCFNFDLRLSNAASQPAFIVLLHRFAESLREEKVAPVSANMETHQPIRLATRPNLPVEVTATDPTGAVLPYPDRESALPVPGFLRITQDHTPLLTAAVHFADVREADFNACGKNDPLPSSMAASIERNTVPDPLWQCWLLVLLAALLVSWRFTTQRTASSQPFASE